MLSVWAVTMSQEKHCLEKEQLALLKPDGMTSTNSHCKYVNYNLPGKIPAGKCVPMGSVSKEESKGTAL